MIVDESDIVTYLTDDNGNPVLDEKGNQKKTIDFNTYEYYASVKCNRPDVGGLILGILGSTLVLKKKRRKEEPEAA